MQKGLRDPPDPLDHSTPENLCLTLNGSLDIPLLTLMNIVALCTVDYLVHQTKIFISRSKRIAPRGNGTGRLFRSLGTSGYPDH